MALSPAMNTQRSGVYHTGLCERLGNVMHAFRSTQKERGIHRTVRGICIDCSEKPCRIRVPCVRVLRRQRQCAANHHCDFGENKLKNNLDDEAARGCDCEDGQQACASRHCLPCDEVPRHSGDPRDHCQASKAKAGGADQQFQRRRLKERVVFPPCVG